MRKTIRICWLILLTMLTVIKITKNVKPALLSINGKDWRT